MKIHLKTTILPTGKEGNKMLENLVNVELFEQTGTVTIQVQVDDTPVAIIFDAVEGRFTLMISDRYRIGAAILDELLQLGDEMMGVSTLCRYEIGHFSEPEKTPVTIFEWRTHQIDADSFLVMMASSNGFIKGGYENIILFNGHHITDYRNAALAQQLATRP